MKPGIEAYPPAVRVEAIDRLKRGQTTREVASAVGVSQNTVWRWARQAGVGQRKIGRTNSRALQ